MFNIWQKRDLFADGLSNTWIFSHLFYGAHKYKLNEGLSGRAEVPKLFGISMGI
ncbi:MAG: hypothetical protein AAFW70_21890 [Cyanobacteria bacterium J06635_10]